jgi:hypothetical protein
MSDYTEPLDQLLALGRPEPWDLWIDYPSKGLRREHAADLIRMATDPALLDGREEDLRAWGPLHAWRALGQIGAVEAVEPLLQLLRRIEENDDDSVGEELPKVFGLIGITALELLKQFASDEQNDTFARVAAAEGIKYIGLGSAHRVPCAATLAELLERSGTTDVTLNALLVVYLVELRAKQHVDVIDRAFSAGRVDTQMCGKLSHIRAELGLGPAQATMRPLDPQFLIDDAIDKILPPSPPEDQPQWMKDFLA